MRIIFSSILTLFSLSAYAEFKHLGEASIVVSGGNSELSTYNLKTSNTYQWSENSFQFGGHYTLGKAGGVYSVRNWDVNSKYSRKFSNDLGAFWGEMIEGNKFSGFSERLNSDLGLSFDLYKTDETKIISELGYRHTYEKNVLSSLGSTNENKGRIFLGYTRDVINKYVVKSEIEYLPNFSDSEGYIIKVTPSITFSLSTYFSFKVGYSGEYDNAPSALGSKKYNFIYTTSLISKL